jgi:DNA-binding PadR family transcriptional regulator
MGGRSLSPQTSRVLAALGLRPGDWRYGYELGLEVGLKSGSLYPILMRLSDRGVLESRWEPDPPVGRPPRHLYRLSATGRAAAAAEAPNRVGSAVLAGRRRQIGLGLGSVF